MDKRRRLGGTKYGLTPDKQNRRTTSKKRPEPSLLLIVLLLCLAKTSHGSVFTESSVLLQEGVQIRAELTGTGQHVYEIYLESNQFLGVIVQQQGIDVVLTLKDPSDAPLVEIDSPTEDRGPEPLYCIATSPGIHRIEIRPLEATAIPGRYELLVEDVRPAAPEDHNRVWAQQAFLKGQSLLYGSRSTEKLRGAIQELGKALEIQEALGDRRGQSWTLYALGLAHAKLGEQKQALAYHLRALPLRGEAGHPNAEGNSLQAIGIAYNELGDFGRAREHLLKALERRRQTKDQLGQGVTLHSLGTLHENIGEFDVALQFMEEALTLSRRLGDREGEFNAFNSIGHLYYRLGEDDEAFRCFEQALALARELSLRMEEAIAINSLGKLRRKRKEYTEALGYFQEALSLFRSTGFSPGEAQALLNIGSVLIPLDKHKEAFPPLQQALSISQRIGRKGQEAEVRAVLGMLHAQMNRPDESRNELLKSLSIHRELHNKISEASTLLTLAQVSRKHNGLESALSPIKEALGLLESVRIDLKREDFRTSFLADRQEYYAFLIDLYMELAQEHPDYASLAFQTSERARARSLLDTLSQAGSAVRRGADPALLLREKALQQAINFEEQKRLRLLESGNSDDERLTLVENEIDNRRRELDIVRAEIRARNPKYAALTQPEPLRVEEVQDRLGPDTLLLSYRLGEERSFVWAVTNFSFTARELPPRLEIETAAREVHDLLSQSDRRLARGATEQAASRLAEMVLGPVERLLGKNRLLIISDGALHYVPFSALPSPGRPGEPLVTEHEIVSLPSASVLAMLRKETAARAPAPRQVAILADPVFRLDDPRVPPQAAVPSAEPAVEGEVVRRAAKDVGLDEFPRLRYTRQEAEAIASLLPPEQVLKALDFEASKETATRSDLSRYRILHFATHGLLDTRRPELSGLVLSLVDRQGRPRDGFLRLHEIYNLDLPADLVVLSGCETALGKEVRGEGLMALTRGFMYAGAPAVVASLWQIDDRSTGELMKRFYRGMIKERLSAPAALRKAQISLWKEKPTSAPYFWAGFVFQGDWRMTASE